MKYIIFDIDSRPYPVLFPSELNHSDVKRDLGWGVQSAGQVTIGVDREGDARANCVVGSVTLGIKFNRERCDVDSEIINKHFQNF